MINTKKKLMIWLEQDLISQQQFEAINHYERTHGAQKNSYWWLYSLLILGSAIIGLGVISLIAANWAVIPDTVKLGTAFGSLIALAAGILLAQNKTGSYWYDALITAFIILCLATIGLISQIYHINGYWYHALLLWSAITLPIVFYSRQLFVNFLWVTLFLHAAVWSGVDLSSTTLSGTGDRQLPALFLFASLLAAACYLLTRWNKLHLQSFQNSFYFWFQISGIIALIFIDVIRSGGEMRSYELSWFIPAYISAAVLTGLIIAKPGYHALNKGLLTACIILLLLYYHPFILFDGETRYSFMAADQATSASFWTADDIRAPFLTILILFLYATHAGNIGQYRTFNVITFLIGLRFVILYFQAMGGLAATGVGLILSGLMIIGIAWFWYKSRSRLQQWSEGLHE
ncbi:MAG: DUF2157 domain-containing protein [Thiolinea sp.]